jgi:hypothetical protein
MVDFKTTKLRMINKIERTARQRMAEAMELYGKAEADKWNYLVGDWNRRADELAKGAESSFKAARRFRKQI